MKEDAITKENVENNSISDRKYYIDNIRFMTVILVVIYHVLYSFNSVGVITNIGVTGIKAMDAPLYFINPWFMALLFVVAGMSARYALSKRTGKEFAKERAKRLLVPSFGGLFLLSWTSGWITNQYVDMFQGQGDMIPGFVKYVVYCVSGIGPLWFAQELFIASMVLLLVRKLDKKDALWELGGKVNIVILLLLVLAVWGSSNILNTPFIEVYRHGIYILMFLLGYYVFSHEEVTDCLVKWKVLLLIAAVVMGICYTIHYFGENYASQECLRSFFTNAYEWVMILAVIGCSKAWLNRTNAFCQYMTKRNFGFYVLHYPLLVGIAYMVLKYMELPMLANYVVILIVEMICLPLVYEVVSRIPVIRFLLLGQSKKKG